MSIVYVLVTPNTTYAVFSRNIFQNSGVPVSKTCQFLLQFWSTRGHKSTILSQYLLIFVNIRYCVLLFESTYARKSSCAGRVFVFLCPYALFPFLFLQSGFAQCCWHTAAHKSRKEQLDIQYIGATWVRDWHVQETTKRARGTFRLHGCVDSWIEVTDFQYVFVALA